MTDGAGDPTRATEPPPGKDRHVGRNLAVMLVAIPTALLMPFVFTYRALREVWSSAANRHILTAAAWLLAGGTIIFMIVEDLSLINAFYFSFITLATIGYGDIVPTTDLGKVITVIYGIAGLGIVAALISTIGSQGIQAHRLRSGKAETSSGQATAERSG